MVAQSCSHCGLAVRGASGREHGPVFCCAGCAIASTLLSSGGAGEQRERSGIVRLGLAAFFSANIMVLTLFLYSLGDSGSAAPGPAVALVRGLLLCFSIPVFALLAPPFLRGMARDVRRFRLSMDSLISLGAATAFGYSCASTLRRTGEVYFDTAAMVLMLVAAGRLIEAHAHVRSRAGIRELLAALAPKAWVLRDTAWVAAESAEVRPGERVRVLAGERVPVDGRVAAGSASLDESALTGEALPSGKMPGDAVFAGALCLDGMLELECGAAGSDSLLSRIVQAVEQAQTLRSRSERMADRLAAVLTPATLLIAVAATAAHWGAGPGRAFMVGLSVLVVACPCALGIAIPLAHVVALSAAARSGILIRSAEALERLADIDSIVFDKTGTLTTGEIAVTRVVPLDGSPPERVIAVAATAAACSAHPVARAVTALAVGARVAPAKRAEELPGLGVRAITADGTATLLGQPRWVAAETGEPEPEIVGAGGAALCATGGRIVGALILADRPAPGMREAIAECRTMGLQTAVLSGDREEAVREVAVELGIADAHGRMLPEDKARLIGEMRRKGRRVAMVGDGINDSAALAAADVGVAVSNGAETARETAEVILTGGAVRIPDAIRLAGATRRSARFNFICAASYNAVALSLAAAGLLRPVWAAGLMLLSSMFVVFRSIRIGHYLSKPRGAAPPLSKGLRGY